MSAYLLLKSKIKPPGVLQRTNLRTFFGGSKELIVPKPALHQLSPPPGEKGHMKYQRYWSNDPKCIAQLKQGDTLKRAFFRKFAESYELYPLAFLAGCYVVLTSLAFYFTTRTIEFGDRLGNWPKIRDKYWTDFAFPTDSLDSFSQRFPLMERLLDEIEEAAEKRRQDDEARDRYIAKLNESLGEHH